MDDLMVGSGTTRAGVILYLLSKYREKTLATE